MKVTKRTQTRRRRNVRTRPLVDVSTVGVKSKQDFAHTPITLATRDTDRLGTEGEEDCLHTPLTSDTTHSQQAFHHVPFEDASKEIRLLRILPDTTVNDLKFTLHTYQRDAGHHLTQQRPMPGVIPDLYRLSKSTAPTTS